MDREMAVKEINFPPSTEIEKLSFITLPGTGSYASPNKLKGSM